MESESIIKDSIQSDVQKAEFEMLCLFKRICIKHGFRYYLSGGTLLGAVRHKGFIPWDDDIDVDMPYEDYISFLKVAQEELGDNYFVQNQETEDYFPSPFTKIRLNNSTFLDSSFINWHINHGIWIDIFPIINIERRSVAAIKMALKVCKVLQMDDLIASNPKSFTDIYGKTTIHVLQVLYGMLSLEKRKRLHKELLNRICNKSGNMYCTPLTGSNIILFPQNVYADQTELMFEGEMFSVPKDYKEYLKLHYGDYMKLPPIEDRKGVHADIIDLNHSLNNICSELIHDLSK